MLKFHFAAVLFSLAAILSAETLPRYIGTIDKCYIIVM